MPGTFAAAGIVCAALNPYLARHGRPAEKISVLIMNKTEDQLVPYEGGYVSLGNRKRGEVLSTENTVKYWLAWNNCGGKQFLAMINPDTTDNTEIEKYSYECCGAEVFLYKIVGGGHTWPGGAQYLPESIIGRTSKDIKRRKCCGGF
jgi:polyhydroxybutyrate depolymerase